MNGTSPIAVEACASSKIRHTLRWVTLRASCTSRRNRSSRPRSRATAGRIVFTATASPSSRSSASNTSPIPPAAMNRDSR